MGEIQKQEESSVQVADQNTDLVERQDSNISQIVSEKEMRDLFEKILTELDANIEQNMDMYYIFRDMIVNGGDFDSSGAVKEQVAILLKNAQDATTQKIRVFSEITKTKQKFQSIKAETVNQQNNIYQGMNRRDMILMIEEMMQDKDFKKTVTRSDDIDAEIQEVRSSDPIDGERAQRVDDEKDRNTKEPEVNTEDPGFSMGSGDFK